MHIMYGTNALCKIFRVTKSLKMWRKYILLEETKTMRGIVENIKQRDSFEKYKLTFEINFDRALDANEWYSNVVPTFCNI